MDPFFAVTPGNRRSPGHGTVPRPPGCWICASRQSCPIGLYCPWLFWKLPRLPQLLPDPAFCRRELGQTSTPQLGPCGSLLRADARRGSYGQCLAPELQTNLQGAKRAGNSPGDSVGRIWRPCQPPSGEGPPPFAEKGHRASPERCAVNNLGKKTQRLLSPRQCPEQSE